MSDIVWWFSALIIVGIIVLCSYWWLGHIFVLHVQLVP